MNFKFQITNSNKWFVFFFFNVKFLIIFKFQCIELYYLIFSKNNIEKSLKYALKYVLTRSERIAALPG